VAHSVSVHRRVTGLKLVCNKALIVQTAPPSVSRENTGDGGGKGIRDPHWT
jgi:hypothetical protein